MDEKGYIALFPDGVTKEQMIEQVNWAYTLEELFDSDENQNDVLKFMLLFNVFEAFLFIPGVSIPKKEALTELCNDLGKEIWFNIKDYDDYGNFFADRYIDEYGRNTPYFDSLMPFSSEKTKITVGTALRGLRSNKHTKSLFLSYLLIAYAFRNNLFHGSKRIMTLNEYSECFSKINHMMYKLLLNMVENDFRGLSRRYPRESANENFEF